eukprot:gnl/MRDRNA2_/MRDRNA2_160357_c0_seq1.p1 gnl/MRDRNA2_/MRDRNA2_160357_c0~~gnl/MRDRNA2_/MRDRNA2_160357_c0_seq1.p1  ORF type:complete len:299 (-),score=27.92 gnl/MRDRNA2_/MRDRNA2_160357_c0_seq1:127-1023(-)
MSMFGLKFLFAFYDPENKVVPSVLTLTVAALTMHRAMTEKRGEIPVKNLLISILIQAAPLCALKLKLVGSSNRLALLSRTASKVLFMYITVLVLRVTLIPLVHSSSGHTARDSEYASPMDYWVNALLLVNAVYIMGVVCEFKWTTFGFMGHTDVAVLHVLGLVHTCILMPVVRNIEGMKHGLLWVMEYANSMEMLAYMPAVWMLFSMDQSLLSFEPLSQAVSQQQATWFLLWLSAFSFYEDFIAASMSGVYDLHFAAGHVLHFLMLLDFSLLFFQQAYFSKAAKDEVAAPSTVHLDSI